MTRYPSTDDLSPVWLPYALTLNRRFRDSIDAGPAERDTHSGRKRDAQVEHAITATHPNHLLMLIRLAASFGSAERFQDQVLPPRSVTVLSGIKPRELRGFEYPLKHGVVPPDMRIHTCSPYRPTTEPVLQLCKPETHSSGLISESLQADFENAINEALPLPAPILILLPDGMELSAPLKRILPEAERLAAIDRNIMLALICVLYNLSDAEERRIVANNLPDDTSLAQLDYPSLMMALRSPSARDAACKLKNLLRPERPTPGKVLTLAEIGGTSAAHRVAEALVADVQACQRRTARWSEIPRSLLLYGEPGTGKTVLAQAIARSAGLPIIIASAGEWQGKGHLGDMLGAMTKTFSDAGARRPCVAFIDEIDSFGARDDGDRAHNSNYRRQVINALLREIDKFLALDGAVLLGACNVVDTLDPAIRRPGRFDQLVELARPPLGQIAHILQRELPEAADITALARSYVGQTPAAIDAALRGAKAAARREGASFDADYLAAQLRAGEPERPALERRMALHETGHALVTAMFLGTAAVERVVIWREGGRTTRQSGISKGTSDEFEREMMMHMAGRAAERLVLGNVSAGSGGGPGSDLERATRLLMFFDRQAGLGTHGAAWRGEPDLMRLPEAYWDRVRVKLEEFERRASNLLEPHRNLLERLADELLVQREMSAKELRPWLRQLGSSR